MNINNQKILSILSQKSFVNKNGRLYFIEPVKHTEPSKAFFKKWPNFYEFLISATSTFFFYGLSAQKAMSQAFLKQNLADQIIINLGSGTSSFDDNVINLDICDFPNVQIVADAANLPFADGTIDMIICESLLEHADSPEKVIKEIGRVIKNNGYLYLEIPFVFPFHASPNDYTRFTLEGLKRRLPDFKIIKAGARSGPLAALIIQIVYILALFFSFGSKKLYWLLINFLWVVFSPFKLFDLIFCLYPRAHESASVLYLFAKKNSHFFEIK